MILTEARTYTDDSAESSVNVSANFVGSINSKHSNIFIFRLSTTILQLHLSAIRSKIFSLPIV